MLDREPFLKAIFAAPADDLPRLVFADWLEENGDPTWAELIRVGCHWPQLPSGEPERGELMARCEELLAARREMNDGATLGAGLDRGFAASTRIVIDPYTLADCNTFRSNAVHNHPEWYGATRLKLIGGQIAIPEPLRTILASPVTELITELDLSGREVEVADTVFPDPGAAYGVRLIDFTRHPSIHPRMVDALAGMRECRRLTALDLRNNDLDNMALNALADSPYFTRLKKLRLAEGQRFRGRAWQRVLAKFGEDVAE